MAAPRRLPLVLALAGLIAAGCGKKEESPSAGGGPSQPVIGQKGEDSEASSSLGFPAFATKNTTRVGGADPVADAAGVAQAVFSGAAPATRPGAVTLVDSSDWQGGLAASVLMSAPVRAPILLSDGNDLPDASSAALSALKPVGAKAVAGAQVIRVGDVAEPDGYKATEVSGRNPYATAQAIDRLQAAAAGGPSDRVVIASAEQASYAMPAASWAAKSGDPILYVTRNRIPRETRAALRVHQQPKIYILGPTRAVSGKVERELRKLGTVKRIQGKTAPANAIAFARYIDGAFGWGVTDPGHGLVFANLRRPLDAAAAAPLSASGSYGPLLLVDEPATMPEVVIQYLLDIQPGYDRDPVRGVYNHGWLIGDERAISVAEQSRIDTLLEIIPVDSAPKAKADPNAPSS